jgi:hypothetical protein
MVQEDQTTMKKKGHMFQYMRVVLKLMPPILLCWPTTPEADVGDMAVQDEPFHQYSVKFCRRATDESRGAV